MEELRAGRVLRAVRRRQGLTQAKVAELAGVSQQTVSLIDCGYADSATLAPVKRVARPLGITVDLVFRWKGPELDRLVDARLARVVRTDRAESRGPWSYCVNRPILGSLTRPLTHGTEEITRPCAFPDSPL